ncbi:MAG: hypothetical protein JWQ23_2095 [Herminiimonas sp.]|nr:hypothetical protein [Herminiimonas sp.]
MGIASRGALVAWLVLLLALATTMYSWHYASQLATHHAEEQAARELDDVRNRITYSMKAYEQVLHAAAAFLSASGEINRPQWIAFVKGLSLAQNFPGIDNIGIALAVQAVDREAHESAIQSQISPDYAIKPGGKRSFYAPIVYFEPVDENTGRIFGFDIFSEPKRRAAMERARDTGEAALTGRVSLQRKFNDGAQSGFLMFLPAFRNGALVTTPQERRDALIGWIIAPFRMKDFMLAVMGAQRGQPAVKIVDVGRAGEEALIYGDLPAKDTSPAAPLWGGAETLQIADRQWSVQFSVPASADHGADSTPLAILLCGIAVSFLLFATVMAMATARARAVALAAGLTRELRLSHEKLESKVKERTEELQTILSASPIAIVHIIGHQFNWVNPAAEAMMGYPASDLIGQSARILFPAEEAFTAFSRKVLPALQSGAVAFGRHEIVARDGRRLICEGVLKPLDPADRARGAVALFQDITERHRNEQALRESEQFNRFLFEASPIGLALSRVDGRLTAVNQAYAGILGYTIEQAVGLSHWDVTPTGYGGLEKLQMAALEGPANSASFETQLVHRDGHLVPVRVFGCTIDRGGERFIWAAVEDITEAKTAEKRIDEYIELIEAQNGRLLENDREKTEFLDNMSHELKTPLNAIIGFSELMVEGIPQALDPEQKIYSEQILEAARHLLELIQNILTYTGSGAGHFSLHLDTVDVAPFLARRLETFRAAAVKKNIALSLSVMPECTVFHAEREYMRTVIDNLLCNAIKFTPEGGRVSLTAAMITAAESPDDTTLRESPCMAINGCCVEIKVTDTGIGITKENLARLFLPFVQIDGKFTRMAGGAGLGLALVRSLVECHGGTVDAESTVGQGSTFRIRLPWRDRGDAAAGS